MKIIDLTKEFEALYFVCLEDWSEEMKEAGNHKETWYNGMKDKGLRVKLALDDQGKAVGMIEYFPIEYSIADGHDLYYINCIWVHGHKQGVGDQRKQGYGKALLTAAEEDARALGAKGIAAHGITLPVWIPASFYKKKGYQLADKNSIMQLLFKPFTADAQPPVFVKQVKTPQKNENPGKVTLTYFLNGCCPACNAVCERAKRAAAEFGDKAVFQTVNVLDRETYLAWGAHNELYIEDQRASNGPPLSYQEIKKLVAKHVKKLK
ncbi:MAG: GNAT family N-acetyltransferase [Clostridiales bacterium]|nr:GNAT family N-acetyltransferase [Clostridiales bacterium]